MKVLIEGLLIFLFISIGCPLIGEAITSFIDWTPMRFDLSQMSRADRTGFVVCMVLGLFVSAGYFLNKFTKEEK